MVKINECVLKWYFRDNSHAESSEDENQTKFQSHTEPKNEPEIKGTINGGGIRLTAKTSGGTVTMKYFWKMEKGAVMIFLQLVPN